MTGPAITEVTPESDLPTMLLGLQAMARALTGDPMAIASVSAVPDASDPNAVTWRSVVRVTMPVIGVRTFSVNRIEPREAVWFLLTDLRRAVDEVKAAKVAIPTDAPAPKAD